MTSNENDQKPTIGTIYVNVEAVDNTDGFLDALIERRKRQLATSPEPKSYRHLVQIDGDQPAAYALCGEPVLPLRYGSRHAGDCDFCIRQAGRMRAES